MHWRNLVISDKGAFYFIVTSVIVFMYSCGTRYENSAVMRSGLCDSVFYAFPVNKNASSFVDSILHNKNVSFCTFRFSLFNDTINVNFNLGDSLVSQLNSKQTTNRYFKVGKKTIPVFSYEDFFFAFNSDNKSSLLKRHDDSGFINMSFTYPDLKIIYLNIFPPQ